MPRYIKKSPLAFCDRCQFKFAASDLRADGDKAGLRVCRPCWDSIDPYRLPPRRMEDYAVPGASTTDLTPETS